MAISAPPRVSRRAPRQRRVGSAEPLTHLFLLFPAIAILLFGMGYPVVWQVITSFQKYGAMQQLGGKAPEFIGLDNYIAIATSPAFWAVALRSIVFCIVTAVITVVLGMLLAVLMSKVPTVIRIILQVSLLLAWAMPVVAAMTVWIWLFDRRRGVVNYLLDLIPGVDMNNFNWIGGDPTHLLRRRIHHRHLDVGALRRVLVLRRTHPGVGRGASRRRSSTARPAWQRLRYILLPMVRPVIMIVLLLNLIWDLRVFTQITMLQDAGPQASDYDLLGTYIYKQGVAGLNFGQGAAMAIFVLALTILISWFYIRSLLKEDQA